MKINKGFELRKICGEDLIISTGVENIDFSKIISLNESAAYLWHQVEGIYFTVDTLARLLIKEYEIDDETAAADAADIAAQWIQAGIVSE